MNRLGGVIFIDQWKIGLMTGSWPGT